MARLLAEAGEDIALLALIESISPRAPMRTMRVTRQRLVRAAELVKSAGSTGVGRSLAEGGRRLSNLVRYEVNNVRHKVMASLSLRLLKRQARSESKWPDWLPVPSARDVYLRASACYEPKAITGVHAILVRAADQVGKEPSSRSLCATSDFGWSSVLGEGLKTVDCPGGHSTLLQEETVDDVAQYLLPAFGQPRL